MKYYYLLVFLNEDTKFKAQKPQLIVALESLCSRTQIYTYPFLYCHLLYLMPLTPTKLLCVVRNFCSITNPFFKLYFLPILFLIFPSHDYTCFPLRFHFHSKFYHYKPSSYRMRGENRQAKYNDCMNWCRRKHLTKSNTHL